MSKQDRAWSDFNADFRQNGLPKIVSSSVALSILGNGDLDAKQCAELGAMLLLDKPLILVCVPGATIPTRLRKAADLVIEDWTPDNHDAQARMMTALRTITGDTDD
jgi:hypothetical protein